jgi:hypothetical protein
MERAMAGIQSEGSSGSWSLDPCFRIVLSRPNGFHGTMLVTRVEEWRVEASSAEEGS